MRFAAWAIAALSFLFALSPLTAAPHDEVVIPPAKTSIYIGSVTLTPGPLKRENGAYRTSYHAKVFPYFFYNESGLLTIHVSDEQLSRLARGERVEFKGTAKNSDGEDRRVEGHATAHAADSTAGTIKVRIFVSPKIELIFNSTYRMTGK